MDSVSTAMPVRPRLRLRLRLALALGVQAAIVVTIAALASLAILESTLDRDLLRRLDALEDRARRRIERARVFAVERLGEVERTLRTSDAEVLERVMAASGGIEAAGPLGRLMRGRDLDLLAALDEDGVVMASADWPEQAGRRNPSLLGVPTGGAVARSVDSRQGALPALVTRRTLRVGSRSIDLVGGLLLDEAFLEGFVGDSPVLLTDADGAVVVAAGPGANALADAGGVDDAGGRVTRRVPFDRPGDGLGAVELAVDRSGLDELVARLRLGFAALGAVATVLAALAGVVIARGITGPVASLVRSVDAIARGEADYTFPRQADHELDELVASFSRLHRSLAEQQRRALAAERVAAWRDAARRVAHEIKNPLAPIRLTVENLRKARRRAPDQFERMFAEGSETILEEVAQLQRLVTEFSEFARLPEPRPAPTDVDALVDAVLALYGSEERIRIERRGGGVPAATIDAEQVSRVLKNLVQNAVEAMGERGGVLIVETRAARGEVYVDVSDDGPGFSAEALSRWTEPYFTTKSTGTGLGTAIAQRIVTEHGGTLDARNRPEGGATVTVRIPQRFDRGGGVA